MIGIGVSAIRLINPGNDPLCEIGVDEWTTGRRVHTARIRHLGGRDLRGDGDDGWNRAVVDEAIESSGQGGPGEPVRGPPGGAVEQVDDGVAVGGSGVVAGRRVDVGRRVRRAQRGVAIDIDGRHGAGVHAIAGHQQILRAHLLRLRHRVSEGRGPPEQDGGRIRGARVPVGFARGLGAQAPRAQRHEGDNQARRGVDAAAAQRSLLTHSSIVRPSSP